MIIDLQLLVLNYLPLAKLKLFTNLNNQFWHNYLHTHYQLNNLTNNFDAKAAAIKIDMLLHQLWHNNLYPTWRYPSFVIDDIITSQTSDIDRDRISSGQPLASIFYEENSLATIHFGPRRLSKLIDFNIVPNPQLTTFNFSDPIGLAEYSKIIKAVTTSTLYLTPFGAITIPFDIDKTSVVTFEYSFLNTDFDNGPGSELIKIFNVMKDNVYVLNFV